MGDFCFCTDFIEFILIAIIILAFIGLIIV